MALASRSRPVKRIASDLRKRAAVYVRVSTEEQVQGYSLDAQDRAIHAYCAAHELRIITRYRDEGVSARGEDISKRPAFARMMADAKIGHFDVLLVHKIDRFARSMLVALQSLQQLEQAGV